MSDYILNDISIWVTYNSKNFRVKIIPTTKITSACLCSCRLCDLLKFKQCDYAYVWQMCDLNGLWINIQFLIL